MLTQEAAEQCSRSTKEMKKIAVSLMFALMFVFFMPTIVFGASEYTVDKVDFSAELRNDGSALITENWTVTFIGESDGFVREIIIPEDNFEFFNDIRDVSVSVDGNGCSEITDSSAANGTYSIEETDNSYIVNWFMPSDNETKTFSLRYVQTGAVKLYNDRAYFYCTAVNESSNLLCRNVTVTVKTLNPCFAEDFSIIESGSLAGKKSDGEVIFSAVNSVGLIKTGLSMPSSLFDTSLLTVIVDDNTTEIVVSVVLGLVICGVIGFGVFLACNYKKIFRHHWEKKCRRKVQEESSYKAQFEILKKFSPARIINIVSDETVSGADMFIVTFLDLLERGYIKVSTDGFAVSENSSADSIKRPLDKSEKMMLDFFRTEKWQKTVSRPKKFFNTVEKFNKTILFVSPFSAFSADGKKTIRRCFELKLSVKRYEFVLPEEISDDIFKGGKYTAFDLIISVLNEYSLSLSDNFEKTGVEKFKRNMFILRETYEEGRKITEKEEFEKLKQKKLKNKKTVINDDIDSE